MYTIVWFHSITNELCKLCITSGKSVTSLVYFWQIHFKLSMNSLFKMFLCMCTLTFCKTFYTQKVHMSVYDKAGYWSITLSLQNTTGRLATVKALTFTTTTIFLSFQFSHVFSLCVFSFINFLAKLCPSTCIWLHACLKAFLFLQTHTHVYFYMCNFLSTYTNIFILCTLQFTIYIYWYINLKLNFFCSAINLFY